MKTTTTVLLRLNSHKDRAILSLLGITMRHGGGQQRASHTATAHVTLILWARHSLGLSIQHCSLALDTYALWVLVLWTPTDSVLGLTRQTLFRDPFSPFQCEAL